MKVCFIYSNRAEYSILFSFIDFFRKKSKVAIIDLQKRIKKIEYDKNLDKVYSICYNNFTRNSYDFLILLGDRRELPFIAIAAFYNDVKIVHLGAGENVDGMPTYDQIIRPIISLLSKKAKTNVETLFWDVPQLKSNAKLIGNPVLRDINIKKLSRIIEGPYNLVLLHPQSLSRSDTEKDLKTLKKFLKNKNAVFIEGNKDRNYDVIERFYKKIKSNSNYTFYKSLPKEKYFSLIKYCDKFYTNSSSVSEIEFLNKKAYVNIGKRNKNRTKMNLDVKAPEKLFQYLNSIKEKSRN